MGRDHPFQAELTVVVDLPGQPAEHEGPDGSKEPDGGSEVFRSAVNEGSSRWGAYRGGVVRAGGEGAKGRRGQVSG